jgi:glycine/D-amino acid oxidase-like deaminating enzyme
MFHVTRRLWLLLTHINNTGKPGQFLCGISPPEDNDPDFDSTDTLANPDHALFEEEIWPRLYERVPAFGEIKVTGRRRSYIAFLLSLQQHGLYITSLSSVWLLRTHFCNGCCGRCVKVKSSWAGFYEYNTFDQVTSQQLDSEIMM